MIRSNANADPRVSVQSGCLRDGIGHKTDSAVGCDRKQVSRDQYRGEEAVVAAMVADAMLYPEFPVRPEHLQRLVDDLDFQARLSTVERHPGSLPVKVPEWRSSRARRPSTARQKKTVENSLSTPALARFRSFAFTRPDRAGIAAAPAPGFLLC
jgi:hypothetical protein